MSQINNKLTTLEELLSKTKEISSICSQEDFEKHIYEFANCTKLQQTLTYSEYNYLFEESHLFRKNVLGLTIKLSKPLDKSRFYSRIRLILAKENGLPIVKLILHRPRSEEIGKDEMNPIAKLPIQLTTTDLIGNKYDTKFLENLP